MQNQEGVRTRSMQKALDMAEDDAVAEETMPELVPEEKEEEKEEPEVICVEMEEWAWSSGGLQLCKYTRWRCGTRFGIGMHATQRGISCVVRACLGRWGQVLEREMRRRRTAGSNVEDGGGGGSSSSSRSSGSGPSAEVATVVASTPTSEFFPSSFSALDYTPQCALKETLFRSSATTFAPRLLLRCAVWGE